MKKAESLLEKGMYNMVGTDLHNLENLQEMDRECETDR